MTDYPRKSLTNVHKIESFSSVHYRIYTIQRVNIAAARGASTAAKFPNPRTNSQKINEPLRDTWKVESVLRDRGDLFSVNAEDRELWIFSRASQDLSQNTAGSDIAEGDVMSAHGFTLQKKSANSISASGLVDPLSWTAPASSSGDTDSRATQTENLKQLQANASSKTSKDNPALNSEACLDGKNETSPHLIYKMLLSAILASISYRLSKLHNYVPLNSRTFLSPPSDLPSLQDSFDVGEPFELREESLLVTLDIRLRGTGTVIVSSSTTTSDFSCATPRYLYESEIIRPGFTDLWLSPSGRVARYVGPLLIGTGIAQDSISGPFEQKGQQMDLHSSKLQLWHFWKERVTEWLVGRGFSAATIEQEGWLIVQILMFQDTITDDEANPEETISPKPDKLLTISWPAKLCYLRRKPNALDTKLGWPVHSDHTDSNDPLKFAEEWFCSRQLRDDIIESGRSARQAQELLAQQSKLSETAVHDRDIMEEPFVRVSNYLDLQTASVMYPTPPDGTHIQGSTGPQLHVGIGSTPDNGDGSNLDHDAEAAVNPEHALAGSGRTDHEAFETGARRSSEISQLAMSSAAYGAAGEDLFADEDADADMFGTSGITEADFSFFDDPDLNDAEGQMFESIENTRSMGPDIYAGAATPHAQDTFADPLSTLSRGNSMPDHSPDQDLSAIAEELPGRSEERSRVHGHIDEEGLPVDDVEPYPNEDAPSGAISILEGNEAQDYRFSSPPLSPISIKKKLIPAMNVQAKTVGGPTNEASHLDFKNHPVDDSRRHCTFDPVAFAGNVDFSDQKYKPNGRFSIASQVLANKPPFSRKMDIPSIGFPKKKQTSGSWNKKNRPIALLENHDDFLLGPDLAGEAEEERSSFPGSQESDQDDSSYTTVDEAKSTLAIGLKRKRDLADSGDDLVHSTSQQLNLDSPVKEEGQVPATMLSLTHFSSDPSDWPFAVDNQRIGGDTLLLSHMNDEEYVRVAQILADQLSSSTLNSSTQYPPQIGLPLTPNTYTGSCQAVIAEVIKSVFDNSSLCDLETFAAIEDRSGNPPTVANNHLKTAKRTAGGSELQRSSTQIFKLQAPHIRVQRAETAIEVLPPALPFWESFGFGPVNGPKDVIAFCLYPPSEGLEHAISTFLEGLGSVYESCKLGSHVPGDDCGQIRRGLVPIIPNEANSDYEMFIGDLKESCEGLGTMLGSMNAENSNIVVYMVNPFTHPGPIADLCAAFLLLYQAYMQSTRYLVVPGPNELVLQLVPISFIASKTSLVVPTQAEYRTLALQVYERCGFGVHPTVDTARTPGVTSSILLSENLPTRISLKLAAEPPSSVLHEQTCLHIAYSTNVKDRWLSASWTDSFGKHQMSVAYCLGLEGSDSRRPFADIAREIWETSLDIVRGTKAKWKFLVVKVGIMDAEELEAWTELGHKSDQASTTFVLLAVDIHPPLSLLPSEAEHTFTAHTQATMYTTPVSTPQPNMLSPEQIGNATTPASMNGLTTVGTPTDNACDVDPESSLVDVADETWGIILSHQIHNTRSLVEHRPGLASGYLIKRGGRHEDEGIIAMSVNLLYGENSDEAELKEILAMYRGLGTLARLRGLTDPVKSVLPWHVASAVKAQEALSSLM